MSTRTCRKCFEDKPSTAQYFGHNPQGGLRHVCRSCMAENNRRHYLYNPDQTQVRREQYKERLESAEGYFSFTDIDKIRRKLRNLCFYCGSALGGGGERDHMVPLLRNGTNWPQNITLACRSCNRDKHDKTVAEFVEWREARGLPVRRLCLNYLAKTQ